MAVDLGTGDGRHVLAAATREPETLFVGVDANAAAMADSSRRAWRGRTALPNALFAVAAAERPPEALHGLAGSLTVNFPWGSLLRGLLGEDDAVLGGVSRLMAPGAEGVVLVSVLPRDGTPPVPAAASLAAAYEGHGLALVEMRSATPEEVAASGSSWAKRLRAGRDRPVTLLRLRAHGEVGDPLEDAGTAGRQVRGASHAPGVASASGDGRVSAGPSLPRDAAKASHPGPAGTIP